MASAAVTLPSWVVPPRHAVEDTHWLAIANGPAERLVGISNTMLWLTGAGMAPMTWSAAPLSPTAGDYELWAARHVLAPHLVDLVVIGGAEYRPVPPASMAYALGVQHSMEWVMSGNRPPLRLPARSASGQLLTVDDLFTMKRAAMGSAYEPEHKWRLYDEATSEHAQSRRITEVIDQAQAGALK